MNQGCVARQALICGAARLVQCRSWKVHSKADGKLQEEKKGSRAIHLWLCYPG